MIYLPALSAILEFCHCVLVKKGDSWNGGAKLGVDAGAL